jgi:enamine deaminase RidA (YjgF/YER057c/UK114 family)
MTKIVVPGTWQNARAFSPAVVTNGGKIVWIAGHTGHKDDRGNSLAGDFEAQTYQTFRNIETTLREAGAALKDIVTMTVFLTDSGNTTRMTEIRTEIFGSEFPASAAITVSGFADPGMLIEIQAIAVIE